MPPAALPIALTIAGSDSGGGAGVQADLKAFAALGVHGTTAVTGLTAQNPREIRAIQPCAPAVLEAQIRAVFAELPPAAIKTGMLFSTRLVRVVVSSLADWPNVPLVVDPVMVATSGTRLLQSPAVRVLRRELLPRATLVTPNLDEAARLVGRTLGSVEDLRQAARAIWRECGCAVLVKGGHLRGGLEAVDVFYDGTAELLLRAPFVRGAATHGTGCTYAAAIAGYLARGCPLTVAVVRAKRFITRAIAGSRRVGRHRVLGPFAAGADLGAAQG
jgi:hydroxymethylpyrimidine/phosphomethylpyrimidine kinase